MALTDQVIMPGADYLALCNAIRAKTGKIETLKSSDIAPEVAAIVTGGCTQTTEFLPTTTFTNDVFDEFGLYVYFIPLEAAAMAAWVENTEPVTVVYDGEEYKVTPQVMTSADGSVGACIGNLSAFGGTGNNEPFAIIPWNVDDVNGLLVGSIEDQVETQHTIRIYQEAIPSFSLVSGQFECKSGVQVVDHGCGEVPDIIVVYPGFVPVEKSIIFSTGFSNRMLKALGGGYLAPTVVFASGGSITYSNSKGIEESSESSEIYGAVRNATWKSFTIGGSTFTIKEGEKYNFFCICGIV